jgi:hypothetical protein
MNMNIEWYALEKLPPQRLLIAVRALVEAAAVVNWNYLIEHPRCPSIKDFLKLHPSLVARPTDLKTWRDIQRILNLGWGDVKDFAIWRIAELRNAGRDDVHPIIKIDREGDVSILVRNQDAIENPVAEFLGS